MTTPYTDTNEMADHELEQKVTRIQAHFPLRSRRECLETLDIVNDDVEKAIAFLLELGPRVPTVQVPAIQAASATVANALQSVNAQTGTGGSVGPGQKGVLNLRTMEWTPLNAATRSGRARRSGTNREKTLFSIQAVLTLSVPAPESNTTPS